VYKGVDRIGERRKIFTRSGRLRNDGSVAQIAEKTVADGKKSGRRREERRGKNGKDNHHEAGGGGRKKLISMKIFG
jgi:hypothetical protein